MSDYSFTLSTTDPNNYVGLLKFRQGDKNSQVLNVTVTENGKLFKFDGLSVFFNAVLPNGVVVRDKVKTIDYTNSKLTYKVINSFLQEVASVSAWFSFESGYKTVDSTKNFRYIVASGWQSCITQGNYIYELSEIQREIEEIISNKDFTSLISKISSLDTDIKYLDERLETANAELIASRNGKSNLKTRIDDLENETTAQLAQIDRNKINKGEAGSISYEMTNQDLREILNGERPLPVVGKNSVIGFENIVSDSVTSGEIKNNSLQTNIFDERLLSTEEIELYNPTTTNINRAISGYTTGELIESEGVNTTDFIFIPKNSITTILDSSGGNIFNPSRMEYEKISLYASNKEHVQTILIRDHNSLPNVDFEYIRIAVNQASFPLSVTNSKITKLNYKSITDNPSDLTQYFGEGLVNFYDPTKNVPGAYSGFTGEIIELNIFTLTQPMKVLEGKEVFLEIDGRLDWREFITQRNETKVVFYDNEMNWKLTTSAANLLDKPIVPEVDGFIVIQVMSENITGIYQEDFVRLSTKVFDSPLPHSNDKDDSYDVFVFMGQSNMAGRGETSTEYPQNAPNVRDIAYEYRAITQPNTLTPLTEPFGVNENKEDGIKEATPKTGSLVSSFALKYHEVTGKKLIGISASRGDTGIGQWQPDTPYLNDAKQRIMDFNNFANQNDLKVRGIYAVWNQGENNSGNSREMYEPQLVNMIEELKTVGVDKLMMITIGYGGAGQVDRPLIKAQVDIARENKDVILVGNIFPELSLNGYLKDGVHYWQQGYNLQGEQAGINAGYYVNNLKEPTMYDSEADELYYSKKN